MVHKSIFRKVLLATAVVFVIVSGSLENYVNQKNDRELPKVYYEYEGALINIIIAEKEKQVTKIFDK